MKQRSLFPDFGGVFLADILANGIGIIIILILIVVSVSQEKEAIRMEKVEDMASLLSRDISTSMVMNSLPTSPPVRLHHYNVEPLDRHPDERLMPILELHTAYARNYYNGKTVSRENLLQKNNALDQYLRSLDRRLLEKMRVDVYSIKLFYIVMSIFKDYDFWPRHWHFLGYDDRGSQLRDKGEWIAKLSEDNKAEKEDEGSKEEQGFSEEINFFGGGIGEAGEESDNTESMEGAPSDLVVNLPPSEAQSPYPFDGQSLESGGGERGDDEEIDMKNLPSGSASENRNERQQLSDRMFSAFNEAMSNTSRGQGSSDGDTQTLRFRAPRRQTNSSQMNADALSMNADVRALMTALFRYMQIVQDDADRNGHTSLPQYNIATDLLPLIAKREDLSASEIAFFDKLGSDLEAGAEKNVETITLRAEQREGGGQNMLALFPNQRLNEAVILQNPSQVTASSTPAEVALRARFGLYPEIYSGLELPIREEAMLLIPPRQREPRQLKWRVVTMVNPQSNDFLTAFVYSSIAEDGRLLLAVEENFIYAAGMELYTKYPTVVFRNENWTTLAYGGVSLFLILGSIFGLWRGFA